MYSTACGITLKKRPRVIGCKVIFMEAGDVLSSRGYGECLWNYLKFLV